MNSLTKVILLLLAAAGPAWSAEPLPLTAISTHGFHDSANHWRHFRDAGRFIQPVGEQPAYPDSQVREIVANILLFQRENGGWPKDYDMAAILTPEQRAKVIETHPHQDTSFDNGNLHSQVQYLARAYAQDPQPEWRTACERGFDFILGCQYPNGGFPQRFPNPKSYSAHITFNDYVMIGIMHLLKDAADRAPHFQWLDEARRARAQEAVQRGLACILQCQIRGEGQLTGWCQQHDEVTFEARPARSFELASICPQDTTEICRFLLRIDHPSPEIQQAVLSAAAWLEHVALKGVKVIKVDAPKEEFLRHTTDIDKQVVEDPTAPPLWARHYEIGTNKPVFAGRDGVRKYAFAEIERERRTGTPWFGTWPEEFLQKELAPWQARVRTP